MLELLLAALLIGGAVVWFRASAAADLARERRCYRLEFPYQVDAEGVVRFLAALSGLGARSKANLVDMAAVVFEVTATAEGITHRLMVPASEAETVLGQLRAALPSVRYRLDELPAPPRWLLAVELHLPGGRGPLRTDMPEFASAAVLGAMQGLTDDEVATWQWVIRPGVARRPLPPPVPGEDRERRRSRQVKLAEPLFMATGRIGVAAGTYRAARTVMRRLQGALRVVDAPGVGLKLRRLPRGWLLRRLSRRSVPLLSWPVAVNAAELAVVLGWPLGAVQLPGLMLGGCRQLAPSPLIPTAGRVLARSTYPGKERPLAVAPDDRRRHLWVVGPTGSGKSTLLCELIAQDMAAGAGVVVVDPMGDLVTNCLDRVPRERLSDVIVLDPTDDARPVGLNPLAGARTDAELVTDQVVGIFRNLYAAFWGPRSDDILRGAVATLVRQPEPYTLCEVPRLLTDDTWRRRLVAELDEPIGLEPFWGWYEGLSRAERTAAIGPVMNKLRAFLLRQRVRRVIGQPEGLALEECLAEGRLLFVSLRKGVLGDETAALLGALFVARLWQATQARAGLPPSQRPAVMGYLDEFQDYLALPTSVATILAQARGLGLGLTLAHQHLGQLPREVRTAVLANARSKVVFQTSAEDARVLAREFAPHLSAQDLQGLGPHEVAVMAAVRGQVAPPATGVTLPPSAPTGLGQAARRYSAQRYGTAAGEVEAALRVRHGGTVPPGAIGRSRRPS